MMSVKSLVLTLLLALPGLSAHSTDRTVTADALQSASRTDLPAALRLLFPEMEAGTLVLVDGMRLPTEALVTLAVTEVERARLVTDAALTAAYGTDGGHGLLMLTTTRPARRALTATYRGNLQMAEKTNDELPTRTGYTLTNQADVAGSDSVVGYLMTVRQKKQACVRKDDDLDELGLRAYIFYNTGRLRLSNDLSFVHRDAEQSTYVKNARPQSEGSFYREKSSIVAERFCAQLLPCSGLTLQGDFSFVRRQADDDGFLSPQSGWFAEGTDSRRRGSYEKGRRTVTTYEGVVGAAYSTAVGAGCLDVKLDTRLFSGVGEDENYAGMGILSDRMGYISFTLGYDTMLPRRAVRDYERTWRTTLAARYEYAMRYGVAATGAVSRSNRFAPDHKWETHGAVSAWWNLAGEPWFTVPMQLLTLGASHGVSGWVDFGWQQFTTNFSNRTAEQYVYNYYTTGTTLNGLANSGLRTSRRAATQLTVDAGVGRATAQLRYEHATVSRLLNYVSQPAESGFLVRPESDGEWHSDALQLTAQTPIVSNNRLHVAGQMMFGFEKRSVSREFFNGYAMSLHPAYGQASFTADYDRWTATAVAGGDRDLGGSTLEIGYSVSPLPAWLHDVTVRASASNLLCWHPSAVPVGRLYTLSLQIAL